MTHLLWAVGVTILIETPLFYMMGERQRKFIYCSILTNIATNLSLNLLLLLLPVLRMPMFLLFLEMCVVLCEWLALRGLSEHPKWLLPKVAAANCCSYIVGVLLQI